MEEKKPLISIITPCLNSEKHIEQTILSVINQNYSPIEYIIIDGGSTDGTLDIIKKYQDKIALVISEKDEGVYDAMNKGIKNANGEIIGILNSDDWYEKNTIKKIVSKYLSAEKKGLIHGDIIRHENKKEEVIKPNFSEKNNSNLAKHPACFVPKNIYKKYGVFEKKYKISADTEFLLRLKKNNVPFYYIPEVLTNFRAGGVSDTTWKGVGEAWEIYRKYFSFFASLKLLWGRTISRQIKQTIKKIFGSNIEKKIKTIYHLFIKNK